MAVSCPRRTPRGHPVTVTSFAANGSRRSISPGSFTVNRSRPIDGHSPARPPCVRIASRPRPTRTTPQPAARAPATRGTRPRSERDTRGCFCRPRSTPVAPRAYPRAIIRRPVSRSEASQAASAAVASQLTARGASPARSQCSATAIGSGAGRRATRRQRRGSVRIRRGRAVRRRTHGVAHAGTGPSRIA
jgi:hypothetical protein